MSSSLALDAAQAALAVNTNLPSDTPEEEGSLEGRVVTHWSFYLLIAGSVVGAIASVAGFVFGLAIIGWVGIMLAISNGFGAFYVKRFAVLTTLEEATEKLAEKVKLLASEVAGYKEQNEKLDKINKEFQKVPEEYSEEINKGKETIQKLTEELNQVADKLEASEAKLAKLANVAADMQEQTGKIAQAAVEFGKSEEFLGETVDTLEENVNDLTRHNDNLKKAIMQLDAQTDEFEEVNQEFSKQISALENLFELMKEMYLKSKEHVKSLESKITSLGKVVPEATENVNKIEKLGDEYEAQLKEYEKLVNKLKNHKVYKKAYKELHAWKKSNQYKECEHFKSWEESYQETTHDSHKHKSHKHKG